MLPVTVIGGYLGAGKTTLVNQLLRQADGTRIAVLVNEFGALPIDADLIETQDDAMISITGGCVCCSYGNDLIQALLDLAKLDPPPDHVVLEASGVALPGAIAASVSILPDHQLDGIVVLADAETVRARAKDHFMGDTIERQLIDADIVLLNKVDLVAEAELPDLVSWLSKKAVGAALIQTHQSSVPNAVVLQHFETASAVLGDRGEHAETLFESKLLEIEPVQSAQSVAQILAHASFGLIRAKGFVKTPDGMRTVQVVGRRWAVTDAPAGARPGIVVIATAQRLDLSKINAALATL